MDVDTPKKSTNESLLANFDMLSTSTPSYERKRAAKSKPASKNQALRDYQRKILGVDFSLTPQESVGKLLCDDDSVFFDDEDMIGDDNMISVEKDIDSSVDEPTLERQAPCLAYEVPETLDSGCTKKDTLDTPAPEVDTQEAQDVVPLLSPDSHSLDEFEEMKLQSCVQADEIARQHDLPTVTELYSGGFGQPSKNHSFTQEAAFETILFQFLKVGMDYLQPDEQAALLATHPLVEHLHVSLKKFSRIDFSSLREPDLEYASQKEIPTKKIQMFMACLFHYDLSLPNVMRYVGGNYTAAYRNITQMVEKMKGLVDDDLLTLYIRSMTVGAPVHMNAESSRENALLYWRKGNHPSVATNADLVQKSMNKLDKHAFTMPFRMWCARFIPHTMFTPHHVLEKPGKDPRIITDASRRYTPTSVPVNMMTSTKKGVELKCGYGDVLQRVLIRIWRLRIQYPYLDIILHANDVKSCFRQMKHHPDVVGAFCYIIADIMYASCGLCFGADFSPQTWEVPRRIAEQLATNLFPKKGLIEKHRQYLDRLKWSKKLGKGSNFVRAHATERYQGVLDDDGKPVNTPHAFFVDDDVYADVYDTERVEQTIACSIEALFMILGESSLATRQDCVSWDKLEDMIINYKNRILGLYINTRQMTIEVPPEYVAKVAKLLRTTWNARRMTFYVKEAETMVGQLQHIANVSLWLKHLISHVYTSLAAALGNNFSWLVSTNKHFREQIKEAQICLPDLCDKVDELKRSFAQGETSRKVHNLKKLYPYLPTLKEEMDIIRQALEADHICKASPISHLIPNDWDSESAGDSSLDAAGGWSIDMKFWWYLEWDEDIRRRTLRYIKDGKSGKLVCINCLEYATVLINYAASVHYWVIQGNAIAKKIPFPKVLILADNMTAESWTIKGCKKSFVGRRLGRLQCSMMINSPVGVDTGYINTKKNIIADRISRWKKETNALLNFDVLMQDYPQLRCCQRFHPSSELLSLIKDALLSKRLVNPLEVRELLLKNPGRVTS